ncbi:adhesin [Cutibacterium equinum]|uniref:Adhesin n=1 Tax=Cutibacterium equinum TaxID=3016342 RepID=A0ABY7QWY0_9ACTN|nr:adhesin [Cutibacterium equinum]WCC79558.1 adhesin [Cutibacterium equinum]
MKNEDQRVTYTPKSPGDYTVWAYCADSAGNRVSDNSSKTFEAYSTKATLDPTTWKSGEEVVMIDDGLLYRLSASLVRDGDTKDYGDLLNSQTIGQPPINHERTDSFTFPSNVPVGNYTLKLTDSDGFVRSVRVYLDHGAGRLLSGSASGSKSPAKPGSKSSSKPGSKSASKTSSKSKSASKATSGKHVVTSGSGAATEKTTTGAASGYDEGVSHVSSGMHTLPHTGV